jgi:hypothetical protein
MAQQSFDVFAHVDQCCDQVILRGGDLFPATFDYLRRLSDTAVDDGKMSLDEWRYLCRRLDKAQGVLHG